MKNFKFDILLDDSMPGQIDLAVESVFSELHISGAFYANILNVTHYVMSFVRSQQQGDQIGLTVNSDYQFVNFSLSGLKSKLLQELQNRMMNSENHNIVKKEVFLIHSLADGFSFAENCFEYVFNIQALSPEVFDKREYALNNYFKKGRIAPKSILND